MNAIKTVTTYTKLYLREKRLLKEIKKIERKNKRMFNDNLIIRPEHQQLYAKKKELCVEISATLMAEAKVLGFNL